MSAIPQQYDVIVVGAGHAGCEAALAAKRLGARTLLVTMDIDKIAQLSCNPAVGGIAKGQIVREIDALGGQMARITDAACLQMRLLNRSKGPAMWSPRAQVDRDRFSALWHRALEDEGVEMWQDAVKRLLVQGGRVKGVATATGRLFHAPAVVLTNGTFLNGLMHFGQLQIPGGRIAEPAATGLTEQLRQLGFATDRMKTGTPVRLDIRSVRVAELAEQSPDDGDTLGSMPRTFSFLPYDGPAHPLRQRPCYTLATNPGTHEVLRRALPLSPLYNGQIRSIGPRYCPSIETKIVTFAQRDSHPLFLEPMGQDSSEFYLNGFSSSLPIEVQIEALRTIPALKDVRVTRPGYAIEYDFFDPRQLRHTLETRLVKGLYMAGQINGTTGYEEAAGQGIIAGINAALPLAHFTLGRDEAYIGVLVDDLVTKGVDEPYRMFTSRAEHRILLRQDNADRRLTPRASALGLPSAERRSRLAHKTQAIDRLTAFLRGLSVGPGRPGVADALQALGTEPPAQGTRAAQLLLRPQVTLADLGRMLPEVEKSIAEIPATLSAEVAEAAEIELKYEGYIKREQATADKLRRLDEVSLLGPRFADYTTITALSTEARQKLQRQRPDNVGEASRIPGVSPSDVAVLLLLCGR